MHNVIYGGECQLDYEGVHSNEKLEEVCNIMSIGGWLKQRGECEGGKWRKLVMIGAIKEGVEWSEKGVQNDPN